jgi:hypothetical protein
LLDAIATVDRGAGSARVAPSERTGVSTSARAPTVSRSLRDWTQPFVIAALLVLLWELFALALQAYRSTNYAGAETR